MSKSCQRNQAKDKDCIGHSLNLEVNMPKGMYRRTLTPIDQREEGVFVDPEDAWLLTAFSWVLHKHSVRAHIRVVATLSLEQAEPFTRPGHRFAHRQTCVSLPRLVLGIKIGDSVRVSHRNGDPRDCRKDNLIVTGVKREYRIYTGREYISASQHP